MSRLADLAGGLADRVAGRLVSGLSLDDALATADDLLAQGLRVSLARMAPDPDGSPDDAAWSRYRESALPEASRALAALQGAGAGSRGGVLIAADPVDALRAAGRQWPGSLTSGRSALRVVAEQAQDAAIPLVLGEGSDASVPATLELVDQFRREGLSVGMTLAAMRRRSEADCASIEAPVRLVKGDARLRRDPQVERFRAGLEVDKSFIRCVKARVRAGLPVCVATHDARLLQIVQAIVARHRCPAGLVEYAFVLGRGQRMQARIHDSGGVVRIRIPYGPQWQASLQHALAGPARVMAAGRLASAPLPADVADRSREDLRARRSRG